jgi:phosphoribosylformimino-5-aminoimidazole carboxamide ribotide isomerase
MVIIPAIDIRGSKVVRLIEGDFDKETAYSDNPVEMAKKWEAQGAQMLHVVDLDGAKEGLPVNLDIIKNIASDLNIPIEAGGGIRNLDTIRAYLQAGIKRVILSTAACENKDLIKKAVDEFDEAIAIGIDAREGLVMTKGWLKSADIKALDLARELEALGVKRVIFTNIEADGTLSGVRFERIEELVKKTDLKVIASGGVASIDDIKKLKTLEDEGLEGAIIGKALYDKRLDLKEAMEAAK